MTPVEIAQRHQTRQGFELVDYSDVALPLYRLHLETTVLESRPITPIREFIFRLINQGVTTTTDIAGFLGLEPTLVKAQLLAANAEMLVSLSDDYETAGLLDRGRAQLVSTYESEPEDKTLVIHFDGLTRKPIDVYGEPLFAPHDINTCRTIEIRPYPAAAPDVDEVLLADVNAMYRHGDLSKGDQQKVDILKIKRVARRVRLFRKGVALVFKRKRASEFHIVFYLDERASEDHERIFAERSGPKKMGFVKQLEESNDLASLRRSLGSDLLEVLPSPEELDQKRLAIAKSNLKISGINRRGVNDGPLGKTALKRALEEHENAKKQLADFPARPISVYEPEQALSEVFYNAKETIHISSLTVDDDLVSRNMLRAIEEALRRSVKIVIQLHGRMKDRPLEERVSESVLKLVERFPNLEISDGFRGKFFHLIKDKEYAIICNKPFLGWLTKKKGFIHFCGFLLQSSQGVTLYSRRVGGKNTHA